MIEEYRIHFSSNIDELQDEINTLNDFCDGRDARIEELLEEVRKSDDIIDNLEHQILDLEGEGKEALNSDKI